MTIESIPLFYWILAGLALIFFIASVISQRSHTTAVNRNENQQTCAALAEHARNFQSIFNLLLMILTLSLIWSGGSWLWANYIEQLTPGKLALISVVIGPIPLLIALLGAGIAKMIGGTLDASKVENCIVFGIDIGNVLYTMFMMHWLMIFTGGLAVLGLMASGIWALVSWVQ